MRGGGDYRTRPVRGPPPLATHGPMPPESDDPAEAGSQARLAGRDYCRSQVCDLQMKAMQPDTSSFLPPSTSSIFDL